MILDIPYYMNRRDNPNSSVNSPEKVYCMNEEYKYIKEILSGNTELWNRFKYYYTWKKFNNYMFTLNRINVKFKHQYILDISQEMRQAESDHELDKSLFSDMNRKRLDMLMANPEAFYHLECVSGTTNLERRVAELENSTTMKVGRIVMYIPIKIKKFIRRMGKNNSDIFTVCRKDKWQIMQNKYDYLVVGAGLYGAVFAHEAKKKPVNQF